MRRILNQAANAAAKHKGSIFQILYGRYVPRLGHNQTIGIIAHKLCRLVWKISISISRILSNIQDVGTGFTPATPSDTSFLCRRDSPHDPSGLMPHGQYY
jgi:hypothetical protein